VAKSQFAVACNCFHRDLFLNLHIIMQARYITVINCYDKEYRTYRRSNELWLFRGKCYSPEIWTQNLFQAKLILLNFIQMTYFET
jgi:hypothetical protein